MFWEILENMYKKHVEKLIFYKLEHFVYMVGSIRYLVPKWPDQIYKFSKSTKVVNLLNEVLS